ncbi:hypothetical protein FA10DRAFT_263930 [Acaromyces ingoldii]|uniref:P-loop containing nucleoside triphosphate hydrolase protein n=1 Tax=Acaromyces ingoldii TaxID=215250 RepID=A0A316YUK8_9BASI|nr:hypothetical protein FA10DRAFT_263930 [Acaromyces ingoldii]PWN93260.1 hypothetical protein FA10DRAFT_263930 [Acaromyces ingoldii]
MSASTAEGSVPPPTQAQDAGSSSSSSLSSSSQGEKKSLRSALLESNPYFNAGFGLMIIGTVLAVARRGTTFAAGAAQRRLLISLEIPSKDRAHPWFLHWMGAQAKAQAMRQAGLLGHGAKRGESLREFIGIGGGAQGEVTQTGTGIGTGTGTGKGKGKGREVDEDGIEDPLMAKGSRASPIRIFSHELSVETQQLQQQQQQQRQGSDTGDETSRASFSLVPGPGTHWFRYKGCWMRLQRERNSKMVDLNTGAPWETVTLTTLRSHAHLFTSLLAEAKQLAMASTEGKTIIYTAWGAEWRPFGQPRRARTLESVVLKHGKREAVEADVKRFMERGWWYAQRGIPYRRGYLLHGSPGSGKSSFITALAGQLDLSICLLNLSERGLTDDKLNFLLSNAPQRSILLLEDVDAAFLGRQGAPEADGYQSSVTFSGLLNALDGVASGESRIIFMTTNHVERLDPALIRPGRVDMIEELGDAESDQVEELLWRFYRRDRPEGEQLAPEIGSAEEGEEDSTQQAKWDQEVRGLAKELARAVEEEALRRRAAVGLDASGRVSSPSSSSSFSVETEVRRQLAGASTVRPMPASRGGVSMAELQGLFIRFPDDPRAAVDAFRQESSSSSVRGSTVDASTSPA